MILGVAHVLLVHALTLVTTTAAGPADTPAAQTMHAIDAFQTTWLLGLSLFGGHLVLLGALVARSRFAPRALGYVLAFAGVACVADTIAQVALADSSAASGVFLVLVAVPSMIGEGWLGLWLLTTRRPADRVTARAGGIVREVVHPDCRSSRDASDRAVGPEAGRSPDSTVVPTH